jgi:hypothetical protein
VEWSGSLGNWRTHSERIPTDHKRYPNAWLEWGVTNVVGGPSITAAGSGMAAGVKPTIIAYALAAKSPASARLVSRRQD